MNGDWTLTQTPAPEIKIDNHGNVTVGDRPGKMMRVRCNWCGAVFDEEDIVLENYGDPEKEVIEHCPHCGMAGMLMDMGVE